MTNPITAGHTGPDRYPSRSGPVTRPEGPVPSPLPIGGRDIGTGQAKEQ